MKKLNKLSFIVIILVSIFLVGCGSNIKEANTQVKGDKNMNGIEMIKNGENVVILDVRTSQEFKEGHIQNAINISHEEVATDSLSQLPDKKKPVIVYCKSGARSRYAADILVKRGYENVIDIGGIGNWDGEIVK